LYIFLSLLFFTILTYPFVGTATARHIISFFIILDLFSFYLYYLYIILSLFFSPNFFGKTYYFSYLTVLFPPAKTMDPKIIFKNISSRKNYGPKKYFLKYWKYFIRQKLWTQGCWLWHHGQYWGELKCLPGSPTITSPNFNFQQLPKISKCCLFKFLRHIFIQTGTCCMIVIEKHSS